MKTNRAQCPTAGDSVSAYYRAVWAGTHIAHIVAILYTSVSPSFDSPVSVRPGPVPDSASQPFALQCHAARASILIEIISA